jgi:hypothetical protein
MWFIERLFPKPDVRKALQTVSEIEQSLPQALGPEIGFDVIEPTLRLRIRNRPDELRAAIQTTGYPINVLVVILARNIVCDELETGMHMMTLGNPTYPTMSGSGLMALHAHLTNLLERAGVETREEAAESRKYIRDTIKHLFGRETSRMRHE